MYPTRILIATLVLSSAAFAGIIQADFNESLDLPPLRSGPKLEQLLGVTLPSAQPQLTEADIIANPSGWSDSLLVSFDSTTNLLTLNATNHDDYRTITVSLSNLLFNITGQVVTGITPVQLNGAVVQDGSYAAPTVSPFFTSNSFGVTYLEPNFATTGQDFLIETDDDIFQVTLGSGVPEPGTLALISLPAAVLFFRLRRKKS